MILKQLQDLGLEWRLKNTKKDLFKAFKKHRWNIEEIIVSMDIWNQITEDEPPSTVLHALTRKTYYGVPISPEVRLKKKEFEIVLDNGNIISYH